MFQKRITCRSSFLGENRRKQFLFKPYQRRNVVSFFSHVLLIYANFINAKHSFETGSSVLLTR